MVREALKSEFVETARQTLGDARLEHLLAALDEEPPVSVRLNPTKMRAGAQCNQGSGVPWCRHGLYLDTRPNFTFDPLMHAGCYYVQEAASMFISHIAETLVHGPVDVLDLCAAPGGKSTALCASLPEGSTLVSNEPVRSRASILLENITKWGHPGCTVTNNYPRDFRKARLTYDVVVCDVPCSGEGMFRKDHGAISQWSPQAVEHCWRLQRDIVTDAWECLRPGGLLIYSTCTLNTRENEENVRWMLQTLDAEPVEVETRPEWHITGSLLHGFDAPVYRFIPGISRTEGLFVAVIRKAGQAAARPRPAGWQQRLKVLMPPTAEGAVAGEVLHLPYPTAIDYLRRQAIVLPPDTPRGLIAVGYAGHRLGLVKNIGSRANNLYPKEWAIKSTHLPDGCADTLLSFFRDEEKTF